VNKDEFKASVRTMFGYGCAGIGGVMTQIDKDSREYGVWQHLLDVLAAGGPPLLLAGIMDGIFKLGSGKEAETRAPVVALYAHNSLFEAKTWDDIPNVSAIDFNTDDEWTRFVMVPEERWGYTAAQFAEGFNNVDEEFKRDYRNNGDYGYL
jgi:hypothetical protein